MKQLSFFKKYGLLCACVIQILYAKGQCPGGITSFPYVEDFETSPAWTTGGPAYTPGGTTLNDWTWGTPNNTVINTAGSGLKCWNVGGLSGSFYLYGERSWIQSPCFDFTSVVHPYIQFKIWWESEYKYDGSNLQYSLDNGTTWLNVGAYGDPTDCMDTNWYNYGSLTNLGSYSHSLPGHGNTSYTYQSLVGAGYKDGWCGNTQASYADTTGVSASTCQGGNGSAHWVTAKHCMPYLAGKPGVLLRFTFGAGTSCNNFDGISIDSVAIGEGAPNMADFTSTCVNTTTLAFTGIAPLCPDTFQWNFGDPGSGASNTILGAGSLHATHTFSGPGTYNVTFTVKGGPCNAPGSITKTVHILGVTATPVNALCNGANDGSIIAVVSGGASPYTYAWSSSPVQHTDTATALATGGYTVTVTTPNACSATASGFISQPAALSHVIATSPSLCGSPTGSAKVTESGGTAPYTYLWSNSLGTTDSIKNMPAGTYTLTVTDAHGCTDIVSVVIANGGGITSTLGSTTNILCNGGTTGSITINTTGGTTPYTYHWGTVTNNNNTQGGLSSGTYVVTVTDANGCSATISATITEPAALTHTVATTPSICGGSDGTAKVTESGGVTPYIYDWSNGLGTADSIIGVPAGSYTLSVTDANGCPDVVPVNVSNTGGATANVSAMTNVTCPGGSDGSITITATGGAMPYTYQWTTSIANNNNTQGGFAAGTYVVTITDHAGCITTVSATISQPPAFSDVISTTPTTCGLNNGAAQITESGGTPNYTYNWSNALGTSNSISNVAAGSYTLTVTDASNCTVAVPVAITAIAPPVLTLTGTTNVSCNGGSDGTVTVSVTAGTAPYTYSWSNTTTTSSNTQGGFAAGIYIITVTDANNCSATVSATINQPQPLTAVPAVTNVTCPAGSNGAIALAVNGGTGQYTFQWTNTAQATQNINGLSANTYTVTVTDANGCQKDTFATVAAPPAFSTTSKIETPTNCSYDSTGTADIVIGGGTPGYTYLWSNGNTTTHLTGLAARTYHLTVTDANGCQYFDSVIISAPPAIVLTTTATAVSCHNGADGTASISALGGDPGFSYVWNVDSTTMSISNESAGTYTVTATDQHQCTASATAVIGNPDSLTITPTVIPQSCANQIDGSVSLQVSGGTPAYSYQWSPTGGSTSTLSSLSAGAYSYTVTDSHGCTATGSSTVALSSAIIPNATATDPLCPPLNNGNIIVNPAGGNPGYNYTWSNSSQNAINSQLGQGVYYLTITDSRGCTQQDTFTLAYTNQLSVDAGQDQTIDLGQSATLTAVTTGGSDISYIWSADYNLSCITCASTEAAPFETFTYTVNVTDTSGCKASDSVTVFVNKTYQLYVPNAFTPNGDGINDYFEIFGNKASWKYVGVMIFDRWGEKVFESTDINFQWDGRFKGALQEPDVFVYVLTVTFIDGYTIRGQKGSITLIR